MCQPLGAKTVKTADSLRSRLVKVKQAMPNSKKGVVYEIPCKDCPCVHWRNRENLAETLTLKRTQTSTKSTGKLPQSNKRSYWRRRVLEGLHIHQQHRISNLDCGLNINATWLSLLDKPLSLPQVTPLTPNQNTPLLCTPSDFIL